MSAWPEEFGTCCNRRLGGKEIPPADFLVCLITAIIKNAYHQVHLTKITGT